MSRAKLKTWTQREPIRNVVVMYDPNIGMWGIWPCGSQFTNREMLTSHKRARECYRTLRELGYIQETKLRWSTLTDKVTAAREPMAFA